MNYLIDILFKIIIYTMFGLGANFLVFNCGMLILNAGALIGIGAYTCVLILSHFAFDYSFIMVISVLSAMVFTLLFTIPIIKIRGDTFAIATLGIQFIIISIFNNYTNLTGGPNGIQLFQNPSILFWSLGSKLGIMILAAVSCLFIYSYINFIQQTPFANTLHAIRDDMHAAQSKGKNPVRFNFLALLIAAGIFGISGSLFGVYTKYLIPFTFGLDESIKILTIIIIGGVGQARNILLGAFTIVLIPEVLRFTGLSQAEASALEQVIYGLILLIILRYRSVGLSELLTSRE